MEDENKNIDNNTENTEPQSVSVESVSVNDAAKNTNDTDANKPESESDKLIGELQTQIADLTDKYMRAVADLENTRRRAGRDAESAARTAGMGITKKILPVMDAVDAALKHAPDDDGIKSLAMAMESAFAQIGVVKIESIGQQLNPQFHSAISVVPADEGHPTNTIIEEMQSGYMYGDTVLRPAMVVVAK
jgi:molecular chaperone GrpE